ncbi:MAG: dihydropteroate synthase [Bacteroidaceae bacterium]|nr:dihydropteroate synthase [Bacteroidaceae bacterium]
MKEFTPYYINVRGRLFDLSTPRVMGILNVTPDSFYEASRMETEEAIGRRVKEIVDEGGTMIDVGAYSTRPGAEPVTTKEEMMRLRRGMKVVREVAPDAVVSVDTFRSDVAKMAVEELGADIVNDVTAGELDEKIFQTVAKMGVPYVLTHNVKPDPLCPVGKTMQGGNQSVLRFFAEKVQQLRDLGQKDIILDPGYGFGKTLEENYELLAHQEMLNVFELPLLVGVSRKSMIYKLLGCTPNEALNGTTVLNTIALQKGASILRVHDVKEAFEVVKLYQKTLNSKL